MRYRFHYFLFFWLYVGALAVDAQSKQDYVGADEAFLVARQKAFNGKREEAREILQTILSEKPNYHDVRILLARTYAWDGQRDTARKELQIVLGKEPDHEDAISALTDVEIWDEKYAQALIIVNNGLHFYPNSEDFIYKKASILNDLNRKDECLASLSKLMTINPAHEKGVRLRESIKISQLKYAVGINYGLDAFSRTFDPAHYSSVQLVRTNSWGSAIMRINYSNRFSTQGFQPELDIYPRIANGVYAYVNYGFSQSDIFPRHRFGGEIHSKLPHSMEASAGIRYLYFGSSSKVMIYTGSFGWYFKDYWISFRPYITPDRLTATSFSSNISLRKYFQDSDNFFELNGGFGFSPDERRIQAGTGLSTEGIYILKSQRAGVMWQKSFRHQFILDVTCTLSRQELSFDTGKYVWITSSKIGVRKKF